MIPGTWAHGWFGTVVKSRLLRSRYKPEDEGQWFAHDSSFVSSLRMNGTRLYVLNWSERNSVDDRRAASFVLARHIEQLSAKSSERHLIVAHSHGGNIALMALASVGDVDLSKFCFAALSTPFIWSRPKNVRDIEFIGSSLATISLYLVSSLGAALLVLTWLLASALALSERSIWFGLICLIAALAITLALVACGRNFIFGRRKLLLRLSGASTGALAENDSEKFTQRLRALSSVLILQPPADEAWLSLVLPGLFMWLNRSARQMLKRVGAAVLSKLAAPLFISVLAVLTGPVLLKYPMHFTWKEVGGGILIGWFAIGTIYLGLEALRLGIAIACGILGSAVLRSYGYSLMEGFVLTLGADVHVEHYPPGGPWLVYCASGNLEGLSHSLYSSLEIQVILKRWLTWISNRP